MLNKILFLNYESFFYRYTLLNYVTTNKKHLLVLQNYLIFIRKKKTGSLSHSTVMGGNTEKEKVNHLIQLE